MKDSTLSSNRRLQRLAASCAFLAFLAFLIIGSGCSMFDALLGGDGDGSDDGIVFPPDPVGCVWSQTQKIGVENAVAGDQFASATAMAGPLLLVGAPNENGVAVGSTYVFENNGATFSERDRLELDPGAPDDGFGEVVALSQDLAVVGAPRSNVNRALGGAAGIFELGGNERFIQSESLVPGDLQAEDRFGAAVAISGQAVAVGARLEDDLGDNSGAVYIFERQGAAWQQVARIKASDSSVARQFGSAVVGGSDLFAVGAPENGSGAVYIIEKVGALWTETARVESNSIGDIDRFGAALALNENLLAIGAPAAVNTFGVTTGVVQLFERIGGEWVPFQTVEPSDGEADDGFGEAIALSGDTLIVGASNDDDGGFSAGAAYVFQRRGIGFEQSQKLTASDRDANAEFGDAVAFENNILVVGAFGDDERESRAGAAYMFECFTGL